MPFTPNQNLNIDQSVSFDDRSATDWKTFSNQVRDRGYNLLQRLDKFPNSVMVTGCQRSGTTMISRIITESEGMVNYWFGSDDELDAAMILSGYVVHHTEGRYCFQTTYVNERYHEYFEHKNGHKILWILRNPYSVVYSMLNNWGRNNPNRLFQSCGVPALTGADKWLYKFFGTRSISMFRRACWGFIGKTGQLFEINQCLGKDVVFVVDYDELVNQKKRVLPEIYDFINLSYKTEYAAKIHDRSLDKRNELSAKEEATIEAMCNPIYFKAKTLRSEAV